MVETDDRAALSIEEYGGCRSTRLELVILLVRSHRGNSLPGGRLLDDDERFLARCPVDMAETSLQTPAHNVNIRTDSELSEAWGECPQTAMS